MAGQVERVDHLLGREDLLVAMAPAEPDQVVAQRRRQVAHGAVGLDAERAVAFRQFGAVRPVDQRDMGHVRDVPSQRVVDLLLAGGVDQVIVAADHMGDAHVVVVDHDRQHVGRVAVAAQQHEVVEVLVLPDHAALHLVLDHGLAGLRRLEADGGLHAGRRLGRIAVAPQAVIEPGAALGAGLLAHRRQFLGGGVAVIGLAAGEQLLGDFAMPRGAAELVDDVAVPIELQPFQAVENRGNGRLGRALAIGVLDPQQHLAAGFLGIEPVEQTRCGRRRYGGSRWARGRSG